MAYKTTLANGIRVVGEEIPTMRSVSIGLWIGTGSRYENPKNNGISHFLEHLLFKGTERYSARELAEVFDGIGGQVNAFTSKEYTCFYAKVLDEHFETAVDTLADMLLHSQFAPEEMEKEKKVVIEEIRMYEDTPDELVMDVLASGVYGSHPLGYTILGREENLLSFSRADIQRYVQAHYTPDNIVIAVAGNVPEQRAVATVERHFGQAFPAAPRGEQLGLAVPGFAREVHVRRKDTEQVHVCLAVSGLPVGDPRLYALVLLNNALGNSPSSRLFQEIREERGLAYSVFSFHSAYRDCGMFGVYAGTSPETVAEVLTLVRGICAQLAEEGLTEEELRKGKEQVKGSMMLSLESTSSRMSRLGKNELLLGREVTLDETLDGITAVTVDDVRQVARDILQQKFAIAAVGPVDGEELERFQ
ncbi:M16 family metallopeptidase [Alicyclobacillus macrosporangiidus]|uniref:Predicted Zn-dependent peptidase n=1 Tax=Alicyclobacillus macrosporangiidus TaxID=392015 RepID=A0A1I7ISA3_9BACL|nr:pitrilysin family protein [Alicyclobacillus macrosporangiidus]SFU75825.1 Predicted Zn-dependent peptidase [Alicyclobacillus macrosporangiidus]